MLLTGLVLLVGARFYHAHFGPAIWDLDSRCKNAGFQFLLTGILITPVLIAFKLAERSKSQWRDWLGIGLGIAFGLASILLFFFAMPHLSTLLP